MRKRRSKCQLVDPQTKDKMVTVRMSGRLFNALATYANEEQISLNQLLVDKIATDPRIRVIFLDQLEAESKA